MYSTLVEKKKHCSEKVCSSAVRGLRDTQKTGTCLHALAACMAFF